MFAGMLLRRLQLVAGTSRCYASQAAVLCGCRRSFTSPGLARRVPGQAWHSAAGARAAQPLQRSLTPLRSGRRALAAAASGAGASSSSRQQEADLQLRVSHILVPQEQAALRDDLARQLADGADFSALAAQHSKCPSGRRGGDLGWVSRGRMVPEFEEAAFGAPPGQVVRCQTTFGLHLLTVTDERRQASVRQMRVGELAQVLAEQQGGAAADGGAGVQLLDVREPYEHDTASLPGFRLLPLSKFEDWVGGLAGELDPAARTVVLCHHGVRSGQVASYLVQRAGFTDVYNVVGGIDAYSREVDPSVPSY